MSERNGLLDKADIINFTVLVLVLIIAGMAGVQLTIAVLTFLAGGDPLPLLSDLRTWVLGIFSGVAMSYGLIKPRQE
ncbi:MAG: hypothetical protein ACE5OO_03800 [Candidatus Bathyarchaeia archaeon]